MKRFVLIAFSAILMITMAFGAVSVSADFVPSVEYKDAPVIVAPADAEDNVAAIIYKANGDAVNVLEDDIDLIPLSEAIATVNDQDSKDPENADYQLKCNLLVTLYRNIVADGLTATVDGVEDFATGLGFENPDMTVVYMFELDPGEANENVLAENGSYITVAFDNVMKAAGGKFIVAHYTDDGWAMVDSAKVAVTEDAVTVSFDSLCPVLFISVEEGVGGSDDSSAVESTPADTESDETQPTETEGEETEPVVNNGEDNDPTTVIIIVVCIVVVVAAAVVIFIILQKKGVISQWMNKSKK